MKKISRFLSKLSQRFDPPIKRVKNMETYNRICYPGPDGIVGVDVDCMIKELSKRTGIEESICRKVYYAEDDILTEIGIMV